MIKLMSHNKCKRREAFDGCVAKTRMNVRPAQPPLSAVPERHLDDSHQDRVHFLGDYRKYSSMHILPLYRRGAGI